MNAFFRQAKVIKTMGPKRRVERAALVNQDFRGESASKGGGGDMSSAELYYELRNGIMKVAYPVFVDGNRSQPQRLAQGTTIAGPNWPR